MEILLVALLVGGILYWIYRQVNQPEPEPAPAPAPAQPVPDQHKEKPPMDFDNLTQEHKDIIFEFTKNLAQDGLDANEQMIIVTRAQEVGIPADKILKVIAQSWDGRPDVGFGVTEDIVFGYFKDIDPTLLGRKPAAVEESVKPAAKKTTSRAKKTVDPDSNSNVSKVKSAASKSSAKSASTKTKS